MQRKSSTRFLILSILVMAVLVVIASSLLFDYSKQIQNPDIDYVNAASFNQFSAGLIGDGYGLLDGQVVSGYSPDTTGYTAVAINDDTGLKSFLSSNSGKYGYLTGSFSTTITYSNTYTLSGVLDGCGNT